MAAGCSDGSLCFGSGPRHVQCGRSLPQEQVTFDLSTWLFLKCPLLFCSTDSTSSSPPTFSDDLWTLVIFYLSRCWQESRCLHLYRVFRLVECESVWIHFQFSFLPSTPNWWQTREKSNKKVLNLPPNDWSTLTLESKQQIEKSWEFETRSGFNLRFIFIILRKTSQSCLIFKSWWVVTSSSAPCLNWNQMIFSIYRLIDN